jgi:hypothetical protein
LTIPTACSLNCAVYSRFGIRFIFSLQITSMLQRYRWKAKSEGKLSHPMRAHGWGMQIKISRFN